MIDQIIAEVRKTVAAMQGVPAVNVQLEQATRPPPRAADKQK